MNLFVADPEWRWWITFYFFLGGIAAGAYFMAALIQLFGSELDRPVSRVGYRIAFPLIVICGVLLILDLHRPERFWHMLFKSEVVDEALHEGWPLSGRSWSLVWHAPMMKYWSPMSVGSWALAVFGLCSFLSFLGSLWPDRRLGRLFTRGFIGGLLAVVGSLMGFFIAAYTGALLTATNQPIWSDSVWIAPLFLASAASTGIAAMILFLRRRQPLTLDAIDRLERADLWALGFELVLFGIFLASLGGYLIALIHTRGGAIFIVGTLLLGLLIPIAIHLRLGIQRRRVELAAAVFALAGGFLLRYGMLTAPPELLRKGPAAVAGFGPEEGRARGGGPGADLGNTAGPVEPRSKVYVHE
jgi:formate-dependent nitrite reductase membrane component NrfD